MWLWLQYDVLFEESFLKKNSWIASQWLQELFNISCFCLWTDYRVYEVRIEFLIKFGQYEELLPLVDILIVYTKDTVLLWQSTFSVN